MRAGRLLVVLAVALVLATAGCGEPGEEAAPEEDDAEAPRQPPGVALEEVLAGLDRPTLVTSPEDGTGRLFVLEQPGRVRVVEDRQLVEAPYLDLTEETEARGEQGLLGLAFDPDFADNGRLYVSYTDRGGDSVLEAFTVDDPRTGRPSGEGTTLLTVEQPYSNHNGGHLAFGPDGYLYYGLGDGGSGGDPENNGQNESTLLGSLLRLDVRAEEVQAPPDNPFVDGEGHELVWAYGLRNPWRFSFDGETGDLFIGDVGQQSWEEIDHQPAASEGGENYGWNRWEANHAYAGEPSREGYVFPILEYAREAGRCSVTGGHVYRGQAVEDLQGHYLYADFCSGTIWAAQNTSEGWRSQVLLETQLRVSSFGEDAAGEVYVVAHGGTVHRIVEG